MGVKISQLPSLLNASVHNADSLPIVDSATGETKQISIAQLDLRWQGVPNGGTTQQVLAKASGADKNVYWKSLSKNDVGLGQVDNTSDANKPISTATQAALNLKANQSSLGLKADTSYVNAQLALKQDKLPAGVDGEVLTLEAGTPVWKPSGSGGGAVTSVFGRSGPAVTAQVGDYDKTMIGLPNVDDTSDLDKPISTLTQTALNLKEDSLGVGSNGKVLTMVGGSKAWANPKLTSWGEISGTMSSQTDLQNALNSKLTIADSEVSSGAIDFSKTTQSISLSANQTFTFINEVNGKSITVAVKNTGVSNIALTFPSIVKRSDFEVNVVAGATNVYTFIRIDGIIYGAVVPEME